MIFEIILFALGAIFLIVSFFVGNEREETETENVKFVFPEEELEEANKRVSEEIGTTSENVIVDTENKLSTMSNETIMFVDDFAKQTMERIQHNHDEVVFMYNMLQTKEEELKSAERRIYEEQEKLDAQKKELEAMFSPKVPEESGIEMARRKSSAQKAAKKAQPEILPVVPDVTPILADVPEFEGEEEESTTQKILALYDQNKSVLDISKQLGIGQGEVKLVIDLYGR